MEPLLIFFAALAAFFAGFIDSIVGGGGLVQVPVLFILFPDFVVARIIGTNRFASFMGTSVAAYQYARQVAVPWRTVGLAGLGAATSSFMGAQLSTWISPEILKPIILFLMGLILVYTASQRQLGQNDTLRVATEQIPWYGLGIGMVMGFYNGMVGPGTGSLLVFGFVSLIGYSFLVGSAIAKFINVIADVASLGFFLWHGYVTFELALPMMVCNMLGSYLGSRAALLRGNAFVRRFFLIVVSALMLKLGYDWFAR